jgi:hypothetical protein
MNNFKSLHKMSNMKVMLLLALILLGTASCKKYLEAKSDQSITTPTTIDDLEGLMNAYTIINSDYSSAGEIASDNFFLTNADYLALIQRQRDFYVWAKTADIGGDYTAPYQAIAYANIVLDALPAISSNSEQRKNLVRGNALFVRASYHFWLVQLFATAYDQSSAGTDLGIALRLTSDIEAKPIRVTIAETYASIIGDYRQALTLLPDMPSAKYLPGKGATYGMLSRVYLSMRDYSHAGAYADSCLNIYNTLIDYNTVTTTAAIPFSQFNNEVIYDAHSLAPSALNQSRAKIDTVLYRSYDSNDLRKQIFFKANTDGSQAFKGAYTGQSSAALFTGVATDEVLLTKAECAVRTGDVPIAFQTLNKLLVTRWKKNTYTPYTGNDQQQAISLIIQERRKELLSRGIRWMDLKRLNKDGATEQTLQRNLNGTFFTLAPNSARYVFQLDQNAVNISGLVQNP